MASEALTASKAGGRGPSHCASGHKPRPATSAGKAACVASAAVGGGGAKREGDRGGLGAVANKRASFGKGMKTSRMGEGS